MAIQCAVGDIHLNATTSVLPTTTSPMTITAWVNASTWATTVSMIGAYGPTTPTAAVQLGARAGNLVAWTWGGGILVSTNALITLQTDVWYHVAYTYDGTTHSLYVNGVLINTSTTAVTTTQLNQIYINGYPTGLTNETSTHKVDSYAFYNRILSSSEILTMASCKGLTHGIYNGLLVAYVFDEGSEGSAATTIVDLSGNSANLTSSGAGTTPITYTYAGAEASTNLRQVQ